MEADGDGVQVVTDKGIYRANRLVISGGSESKLLAELEIMEVKRLTLFWFDVENSDQWQLGNMPIYIWEQVTSNNFTGFLRLTGRMVEQRWPTLGWPRVRSRQVDRTVRPEEIEQISKRR